MDIATERAVRSFLTRVPADIHVERAFLFGSRARGNHRPDSDADIALIVERDAGWNVVETLAGLAFDVLLDTGILIQAVPIPSDSWDHPERFSRPSLIRTIARDGIAL